MAKVTRDMTIKDVLEMDKDTTRIFISHGMYCLGCPAASGESIETASMVHGIDADKLVADLNAHMEKK